MNREFAFAEMVGLFAGFDKPGAIGRGETDTILDDRETRETRNVTRET